MQTILANQIHSQLEQVESLLFSQVDARHAGVARALHDVIASGGKRLRPKVTLLVGGMLDAEGEKLIHLAAAIELLHTASLIHDDLIDNSTLRRGSETLNAHYSSILTVLAGDFAFARAAKLASDTGSNPVMRLFADTLTIMTNGELEQASRKGSIASREEYYAWIHAKTASLFELAAGAAAVLSQADEHLVAAARRFGYEIGMAFQIVDDVLDFTANANTLGKPTGSDLRQGVITLPALHYLEKHPEYPIGEVIQQSRKQQAGNHRLEQLISDIRTNGSIQHARQEAEGFVQRALEALAALPDTQERRMLEEIAGATVRRER